MRSTPYAIVAAAAALIGTATPGVAADGKALAGGARVEQGVRAPRRAVTAAEVAVLARQLSGMTEQEVRDRLGRPDRTRRRNSDWARLAYWSGQVTVYMRDGVVVDVGGTERQTGVREDDFVGLVGP
jgi:hypothetical protein